MTKYGVVLGGGGAKGCYEIGVWKALLELKIPICAAVGTSVGALNGAMMVQGDFDIAYELWNNIDIQSIINLDSSKFLINKQFSLKELINAAKALIENKGIDITPLKKMLKKYISESRIRISELDFGLVTFSLTDFKPVAMFKNEIPKGLLLDYLLASSCLPGFQTIQIENKTFLDGGIYDNIPISLMVKKDIKNVIAVDVSGIGRTRKINLKGLNVIYIKNSDPICKTLEFEPDVVKKGMTMGYMDTLKAFSIYKGKRYYIKDSEQASIITAPLQENELTILDAILDIKVNSDVSSKLINYTLIRTIYRYVQGKLNSSSLIYAAAEIAAEVFAVDRYKAYTWDELANEILKSYASVKSDSDEVKNQSIMVNFLKIRKKEDIEKLDIKGIAAINTDIYNQDVNSKLYRKLMAIFAPKICIANIFVSLILWRKHQL